MSVRTLLITLLLVVAFPVLSADSDIVACIDDHPPYQHLGPTPYGTHITALEKLAGLLDKNLAYIQSSNFARCVSMLQNGKVDVIAGFNKNAARERFAFYAPFKAADDRIVITRFETSINAYSDLKGLVIGVPRGTTYFNKFDNDKTLNKVEIHNPRTGIKLLKMKRIDAILSSPHVVNSLITDINKAELKTSLIPPESYDGLTRFGFSKKHRIGLSEQEIIHKVTEAYKAGYFTSAK